MQQLLNNILKKLKGLLTPSSIGGSLIVILAVLWVNSTMVSATVWPVVVNVNHLEFGTVFPGEYLQNNFTVTYTDDGSIVQYMIVKKIKYLPSAQVPGGYGGTISEYCQEHPDDLTRCYRDLCPFLEEEIIDQEADTKNLAFVGPSDLSDAWVIYFRVPAIFGHVGQDHIGEVVTSNGEYGCDVSIDISE